MKNLYIDFDGVIMNTITITYEELKRIGLDFNKVEDQNRIREYYSEIDWNHLLNKKATIINDAFDCIKKIISSNRYYVTILSHVNSLSEAEEKVKFIRKHLSDITIIPVPRTLSKTEMVNAKGAILVDDYAENLNEWKKAGGIGIKFSTDLNGKGFIVIDKLSQILEIASINE